MNSFEIILNLKAYHESTGENAIRLSDSVNSFLSSHTLPEISISVAPNLLDLQIIKKQFPLLNLISPHADAIKEGKQTGWVPGILIRRMGITRVIINHTEHRLHVSELPDIIIKLKEIGFEVIVCCQTIEEAKELQESEPYAIAFELPALIGSGKSIMHEEALVKEFVSVKKASTRMYVGAGISSHQDILSAITLGIEGVLLATAFVFADDPQLFLEEITSHSKK